MIILADSVKDVAGVYPDDARVHVYVPKDNPSWSTIGEKRNAACDVAKGQIFANFDDDDYSGPDRIAYQVGILTDSGKSVCAFRNVRFTDGDTVWINTNWPMGFGSSHCFTHAWWEQHPYPDLNDSEDLHFLAAAMKAKQFVAAECGEHLLASIHNGNTSPRAIGEGWVEIAA